MYIEMPSFQDIGFYYNIQRCSHFREGRDSIIKQKSGGK